MMLGGEEDDDDEDPDYEDMWLVKMFNKVYPIFPALVSDKFFVNKQEVEEAKAKDPELSDFEVKSDITKWMTPAFVCLLVIEGSDVLFAVDSVPAVIAVTKTFVGILIHDFFAILGLRSLYFVLVVLTKYLVHLEKAVVFVLFFIAFKMFLCLRTLFSRNQFASRSRMASYHTKYKYGCCFNLTNNRYCSIFDFPRRR